MAFKPVYIAILGFTIVVDYFAGILIEQTKGNRKKVFLIASLIANIGVLGTFKYWNFINQNITDLLGLSGAENPLPFLDILLPVGLSFHTFQAMSYTIEVYRGHQKAERHFGIYSLYVMFYPQLVAGPIERPQNLLHQFREEHSWDLERFRKGFSQMLWGFFKKVVIADRLSIFVNEVYGDWTHMSGANLWIAVVFFSFQIYCDFSGYSDIAIGSARIMGFDLMTNFNKPYFARSVEEFWKRWHISLSTWFRDYLYIPLGGNRHGVLRRYINLTIIFLVSGIWHGAGWNFVLWGALHAAFVVIELVYRSRFGKAMIPDFLKMILTFFVVSIAWIFFRTPTTEQSFGIIEMLFGGADFGVISSQVMNNAEIALSVLLILVLLIIEKLDLRLKFNTTWSFAAMSSAVIFIIYLLGVFNQEQFIYFQF
jgi:D-alanyl-lipoteichoic acid acyltransferase DltB (MBOAT superfamily)